MLSITIRSRGSCTSTRTVRSRHRCSPRNHHARWRGVGAWRTFSSLSEVAVPKTMKALVLEGYNGIKSLSLREIEAPLEELDMKDHEVLVRVHAASINPLDIHMSQGYAKDLFETQRSLPVTLGRDFSGTIEAVGSSVWDYKVNDEVIGASYPWLAGSFAEYLVISQHHIARKPSNLTHEEACTLPFAGLTAYSALHNFATVQPDMNVLVHGASGGVGSIAVQLLVDMGCKVTATCNANNIERVQSYGAQAVVDYNDPVQVSSITPASFHVVLDAAGAPGIEEQSIPLIKPGGTYVTVRGNMLMIAEKACNPLVGLGAGTAAYLSKKAQWKRHYNIDYMWAYFTPNGQALEHLVELTEKGKMRPNVAQTFTLSQFEEAFDYLINNKPSGKVVLKIM